MTTVAHKKMSKFVTLTVTYNRLHNKPVQNFHPIFVIQLAITTVINTVSNISYNVSQCNRLRVNTKSKPL